MAIERTEPGSCVTFGPFEEKNYFDIEGSNLLTTLGPGVKSVEFFTIYRSKLVLLEAKKTAPKTVLASGCEKELDQMIKEDSQPKYKKWKKGRKIQALYLTDICQKFEDSLNIILSAACGRLPTEEIPEEILELVSRKDSRIVFLLVITWSKREWVSAIQDAFNMELSKHELLNKARVVVLTAEDAKAKGLVMNYEPMPEENVLSEEAIPGTEPEKE